jgi:hypothetical protein
MTNLHKHGLSATVRDVFRKIVAQDLRLAVWIDPYGDVTVKQNRADKGRQLPDEWLVGEYNWRVPLDDIHADIKARAAELRPIYRRVAANSR